MTHTQEQLRTAQNLQEIENLNKFNIFFVHKQIYLFTDSTFIYQVRFVIKYMEFKHHAYLAPKLRFRLR